MRDSARREATGTIGVLYLMPWLIVGGAENQVVQLLRFMDRQRFKPVACCIREPGALMEEVKALGITTYCLHLRPKYGFRVLVAVKKILEIIRRERIEILQAMEFNARVLGSFAAKAGRVPVSLAAEHYTGEWQEPGFKKAMKRLTVPFVDRIICVAHAQKNYLVEKRGFPPEKLEVIYNGIDLAKFDPRKGSRFRKSEFSIPEESPVVGIIAALRPEKAHHIFLKAAKRIAADIADARFMIVGDGEERTNLEHIARELGIAEKTVFTGVRTDVPEILSLLDVAVLCSYPVVETFPVSLLEAMAMEVPVVATRVSGIPEMVEEGKNGFLVPVGDDKALAEAVSRLLSDRGMARRMGALGRRKVEENFTIQKTVEKTQDLYLALLESKGKRRNGRRT
jgi:glycosyltransferase involved in cell wall biosynthesis